MDQTTKVPVCVFREKVDVPFPEPPLKLICYLELRGIWVGHLNETIEGGVGDPGTSQTTRLWGYINHGYYAPTRCAARELASKD